MGAQEKGEGEAALAEILGYGEAEECLPEKGWCRGFVGLVTWNPPQHKPVARQTSSQPGSCMRRKPVCAGGRRRLQFYLATLLPWGWKILPLLQQARWCVYVPWNSVHRKSSSSSAGRGVPRKFPLTPQRSQGR